jgi:hypothetical protein
MTAVLPRPDLADTRPGPRPPGLRSRLPRRGDRPAWLRLSAAVLAILAIALALALASVCGSARDGVDTIGGRTAPAVSRAEDLSYQLSDMDAQLANVLLAGADAGQAPLLSAAGRQYEQDRAAADGDLEQAIEVAGGNAAIEGEIHQLLDDLGRYEALAAQTMQLNANDHNPAGRPSADVLALDHRAIATMADTVARAADVASGGTGTGGEVGLLQQAYANTRDAIATGYLWLAVLGVVLLATIIATQVWLRLTVRRWINLGLAAATAVIVAVLIGGLAALGSAAHQLTVAKQDAFDSLSVLQHAKAASSEANADESRYLADTGQAADYERQFFTVSQQLARVDATDVHNYDAGLKAALDRYAASGAVSLGGDFGKELDNITFPGERDAALAVVRAFQQYQLADRRIRAARDAGDLTGAITIDTSTDPGQSDYDFGRYTADLGTLIDINQHAFDRAISASRGDLSGWDGVLPYGAAALVVVLLVVGMQPRLAEYR